MERQTGPTILIAAALIDDGAGRLLLVRKAGSRWFMQPGGKTEQDESALSALRRELVEEIGLAITDQEVRHIGRFASVAANERNSMVDAEIFHVSVRHTPTTQSEIDEAVWVSPAVAMEMPLAPLTRDHIVPLFLSLQAGSNQ